ncbi:MAG: hypothetical protein OEY52_02820 [Gammaproteobacteria bacterium]|nr:hypothetical protein [Gammaproteobacteria bacterium]
MKIYPINNENHQLHAFEIDNSIINRKRVFKIISSIDGVNITKKPKRIFSWFRESVFCEFEINGIQFEIEEPFGDNSRYWVGKSKHGGYCDELLLVADAFRNA